MRTFIAIEIDRPVVIEIYGFVNQLSKIKGSVNWVKPENIHLTLKFLGEVQEEIPNAIASGLRPYVSKFDPFSLTLEGAGGFPNLKSPRVLWVGVDMVPQLKVLYEAIEDVCERLGFQRENRPFSPHITIGRVKGVVDEKVISMMKKQVEQVWGSTLVRSVNIMRSVLRPTGAEYSVIASVNIG